MALHCTKRLDEHYLNKMTNDDENPINLRTDAFMESRKLSVYPLISLRPLSPPEGRRRARELGFPGVKYEMPSRAESYYTSCMERLKKERAVRKLGARLSVKN